jgi:hypothetical protein
VLLLRTRIATDFQDFFEKLFKIEDQFLSTPPHTSLLLLTQPDIDGSGGKVRQDGRKETATRQSGWRA